MILTPLVIAQLFSIGTGLGSQVAKMTGNDEVAQKLGIASIVSGAVSSAGNTLKDAFTAPKTGLGIADFKGDITQDFGAFKDLPKDMTKAIKLPKNIGGFGGKSILPESLGGAFKSPEWNASESIFNSSGKEELGSGWIDPLKF